MQNLAETDEEQTTIQIGQDLIHLVSHQLINSAGSLQMIYELLGDESSIALSAPDKAETLQSGLEEV